MPQINWDMLNGYANVGQAVSQGFEYGQQQRKQYEVGNALRAYATNPDDPRATAALIQVEPRLGFQVRQQQMERERTAQIGQLTQRAASGDAAALAQVAGIDLDAWAKLDTRAKAQLKEQTDYIGEAALAVSQLPEAQRPAAWDSYVDNGVSRGMNGLADYKGKYSPEGLNGALAAAGKMKQFLDTQKIEWHQQGERPSFATRASTGELVDPAAVTGGGVVTNSPTSAVTATNPETGETVQYNDKTGAWEPVGGATASPSPTFR